MFKRKTLLYFALSILIGITMTACGNNSWQHQALVDFDSLQMPSKPHYCLACPNCSGYRQVATPTYSVSAQILKTAWQQIVLTKPRVQIVLAQDYKQRYVQRSAIWHFPDIIDVQFVPIDSKHSQIQLFSRSVYGYYDFGVNCRRVNRWLNDLHKHINQGTLS